MMRDINWLMSALNAKVSISSAMVHVSQLSIAVVFGYDVLPVNVHDSSRTPTLGYFDTKQELPVSLLRQLSLQARASRTEIAFTR